MLVGRKEELGSLLAAALDPPAVALVEGEAGVGKTRLVRELASAVERRGRRCYVGGCQQLREPFPLGALVEALRQASFAPKALSPVCGALLPLLPELESRLPELPKPLGDRQAERHRLFRALREFTSALGESVLVLEDLHWADDATVELLRFLAPQLPPGLALVCTYRREDLTETSPLLALAARLPSDTAGVQVTLEPLAREQVRELAGEILELDDVSEEFSGYLFDASGGLPFAVEEVLRLLTDRKDLMNKSGVWVRRSLEEIGVPKGLRDSILERLGRLSVGAQRIVHAAAVLEIPTAGDVLADVAGVPGERGDSAITQALASALLIDVGDHHYSLRHMLACQIVDDALSTPMRRRLHLRATRSLEQMRPRPLGRLAHHYKGAGETKLWIRHAERAADQAISREDDATAYRFLEEAVSTPGLPPATKGRLAIKLASHALFAMEHPEAIEFVRRLLDDEALPRGDRGQLRGGLALLLFQAGQNEAGYAEMLRALDDLGRRPARAARAMGNLALPWVPHVRVDEHLRWADEAVRTAARSGDRAAQRRVAVMRAVTLLIFGDPRGWNAFEQIPRPDAAEPGEREAAFDYVSLSDALLNIGYHRRAKEFLRDGVQLAHDADDARDTAYLAINELLCRWLAGEWEGLEERARASADVWQDWGLLRSASEAVLGLLLLARGDVHGARQLLSPLADSSCSIVVDTWVAAGLARIELAEGRGEVAAERAATGLDIIEQKGSWAWAGYVAPVAVEALLAAGRPTEATALTRRFDEGLSGLDAPAGRAALQACDALLAEANGDRSGAARRYLAAERAWQELPSPYEAARAREYAGRCLLAGQPERGRRLLVAAMDAFRGLGAAWDEARARHTLRDHGHIPPHRGGRKGYGSRLTPREAQVVERASDGKTNREIATELFLSPRTVEHYLTSAMRKLGVTSRRALSRQLETTRQ